MSGPAPDRRHLVDGPGGPLEVLDWDGDGGGVVVLLPSLGRGARDFDDLADRLQRTGRRVLCPQPRGWGAPNAELSGLTLADLAD
ncbi:MAG: alpha/beta hydrolase, partial [Actinomyces sp.]